MKKSDMWRVTAKLVRPAGWSINLHYVNQEDALKRAQTLCVYGHKYTSSKTGVTEFTPPGMIVSVKVYPPKSWKKMVARVNALPVSNS